MKTFLPQNEFIPNSTAIQPPAVEQPATASLTLPASGAVANLSDGALYGSLPTGESEPLKACASSEPAVIDSGRAVTAGLTHNAVTQAVEVRSETISARCSLHDLSHARDPQVGLCGAPTRDRPQTNPELVDEPDFEDELTHLIGVAGKRRRRPLALPRFVPDKEAIWDAMQNPNAPRALETDPVWADAPPIFLKG